MEKSKLWMIIIIAVLVLMCAGFVVGFILLKGLITNIPSGGEGVETTRDLTSNSNLAEKVLEDIEIVSEKVVSLLAGEDGKSHVLKYTCFMSLDKTNKEEYEAFHALITGASEEGEGEPGVGKLPLMESSISDMLSQYTIDDLRMPEAKAALSEVILQSLREHFGTNIIHRVFFTDWVTQ